MVQMSKIDDSFDAKTCPPSFMSSIHFREDFFFFNWAEWIFSEKQSSLQQFVQNAVVENGKNNPF